MTRTLILFMMLAGVFSLPLLTTNRQDLQGEPVFNIADYLPNSASGTSSQSTPVQNSSALSTPPFIQTSFGNQNPAVNVGFPQGQFQNASTNPAQSNVPTVNQQPIVWNGPTTPPPRVYQPTSNLAEVIRFDVFPTWVKARWQTVANTPGDLGLEGMRVPLVTGNSAHDLAGSLTYYFDDHQQVQRICFQGWTGDATYLVQFLTDQHGFKKQPTTQAGFYLKKKFYKAHSLLRLEHPPIVNQSEHQKQMFVYMELNHPQGNHPLTIMGQQALATAR